MATADTEMQTPVPPLRLVFWESTQACNLACKHCRASAVSWRDPGELSFDEACAMMDAMARLGSPVLVFSGGEPLMRPDIFDLMAEARRRGLPYALSTNGTLLDDAMADKVQAAAPHRVSISLDGADPDTHDSFRQAPGAFEASLQGMRRLRARGVEVQVNTSVTTHNLDVLPEIFELVKREGCVAWHLFMLVPVGCGLQIPEEQRLAAGQYERSLRWFVSTQAASPIEMKATCAPHVVRIARQMYPAGLPAAIQAEGGEDSAVAPADRPALAGDAVPPTDTTPPADRAAAAPPQGRGHPGGHPGAAAARSGTAAAHPSAGKGKGCLAGRAVCFVSRFGLVQPCGYLPLSAGHLRSQPLDEVWRDSAFFAKLRDPGALRGKCGVCEFKSDCMGCRARAYAVAGNPLAEEPLCAWNPREARPGYGSLPA
jgi:radical SAM protein with 4Fe4S-binding SPASM domain